ncbi:MAG: hypothetical protein KF763_19880 [Cyclobacteriaceae bacterium]|nr:hypothetical protein [Cyclobacteriaceae bacterium]
MMKIFVFIALVLMRCGAPEKSSNRGDTKEIGGLVLPDSLIAIDIVDESDDSGDGYLVHRYKISEENISELKLQREFSRLPFKRNEVIDNRIYDYLDEGDHGYYSVIRFDKEDPRDQMIVLLNSTRMELTILMTFV